MRAAVLIVTLTILCEARPAGSASADGAAVSVQTAAMRRRPVAAALVDSGRRLLVVNQRSGTVSLIDTAAREVLREQSMGQRLSDMAVLSDEPTLLLTDESAHELLIVRRAADELRVIDRQPVARYPTRVAVSPDGHTVAVAGLWSRRITLLARGSADPESEISNLKSQFATVTTVRLPFAPRLPLFVDEGRRLAVADAFGGRLAVIDPHAGEVESIRELPAQNIRGLSLSVDGTQLLLAHQMLDSLVAVDYDNVHWGTLLQNVVREVPLPAVLDPKADLDRVSRTIALGDVETGAADPAGLALLPELDGWITCLSGTGEVAIQTRRGSGRVPVGARPTSVVWDADRRLAYVVCTLDDAVAVVDPIRQRVVEHISLGPQPEPTPADRGERLFVDGLRSHDGWLSCQSCHPDGHTTGGLADTSSDGSFGTPKQILSLLGTRDNNPWAWNGQFRELHEQIASSFTATLHGDPLSPPEVNDVVAYLHTLTPPPPVDEGERSDDQLAEINRGRDIFNTLGCGECHVPPQTYTVDQTFDVGLEDDAGLKKFNPPSLRGLSQRERYFHDGRAEDLEAVFTEYGHQLDDSPSPEELHALLAFLRSL